MKTLRKVYIEVKYVESMPPVSEMEENKIYISEKYHSSTHRCLCGCGSPTVLPINHNGATYGWDLYKENNGTVSFTPSVGNYSFPCKSHYIITKNVANFV